VLRFVVIFVFTTITASCYPEHAFQPGPPEFKSFEKKGASDSDIKAQMLSCGYSNPYSRDRKVPLSHIAETQICMFNNGYRFKDGDKGFCYGGNWKEIPACAEYRKAHP